jgi:hypothetical protein
MNHRFFHIGCRLSAVFFVSCQNVITVADGKGATDTQPTADDCAPIGTNPLVCENFETGINSPVEWYNGQVTLDTDQVYMGQSSMKAETLQISSFAFIVDTFNPIESGTIFFRVYLYIPPGNSQGTTKVLNLSAGGNPEEEQGVDIDVSANRSVDIYQHGNAVRFVSAPDMVPEGQWFCLKGSYTISDTAGTTSVWINSSLAVSTTASSDSIINGGVSEFRTGIGWTEAGQDTSLVYFDNVLVDTEPVECSD